MDFKIRNYDAPVKVGEDITMMCSFAEVLLPREMRTLVHLLKNFPQIVALGVAFFKKMRIVWKTKVPEQPRIIWRDGHGQPEDRCLANRYLESFSIELLSLMTKSSSNLFLGQDLIIRPDSSRSISGESDYGLVALSPTALGVLGYVPRSLLGNEEEEEESSTTCCRSKRGREDSPVSSSPSSNFPHDTFGDWFFGALFHQPDAAVVALRTLNLNEHFNPNSTTVEGSPGYLRLAIQLGEGFDAIIGRLLELGADVKKSKGVIHDAAASGNVDLFKRLIALDGGSDVHSTTESGLTPLMKAAQCGHLSMVQFLISAGADMTEKTDIDLTAFTVAVGLGHLEIVKYLASLGCDVHQKDHDGVTPISLAVETGLPEVVRYLASVGADVNERDETDGVSLLHIAASEGYVDVFKTLIELGADVMALSPRSQNYLHVAARYGNAEIIRAAPLSKELLNHRNAKGMTPLTCAVDHENTEAVKALIELGADTSIGGKTDGCTLMERCSDENLLDMVKLLHSLGVKIDTESIVRAAALRRMEVLECLLELGGATVDLDRSIARLGGSPLTVAAQKGQLEVVKLLHRHGADLNSRNNNDCPPPLIAASQSGQFDSVQLLLELGADPTIAYGTPPKTALEYAIPIIVELFQEQ